jgi:hypothetical protein
LWLNPDGKIASGVTFSHQIRNRFSLVVIGGFVLLQGLCPANEVPIPIKPTFVYDARGVVMRGGDGEITLKAVPNYGNPISFEVIKPPTHGILSIPKNVTDHSAVVSYRHDGSKGPLNDAFSFRARTIGRAVSAISKAEIRIIPPSPLITFSPALLNFGDVILSESRTTNVSIANLGGTKATGRLVLPKGFTAPDGDRFSLEGDESVVMAVSFSPMEDGLSFGEANTIPSYKNTPLTMKGVGRPRFEIIKKGEAEYEVINRSSNPIRMNFSGGNGWQLPAEKPVPPNGRESIRFQQMELDEAEGLQHPDQTNPSIVHISDGLTSGEVELPAPKRFIPLMVQRVLPDPLLATPFGASIPVSFRVQNRSEFPKKARWSMTSQSGGGSSSSRSLEIGPGEVKETHFDWVPTLPGEAVLKLLVDEGSKKPRELFWKTRVLAASNSLPNATENPLSNSPVTSEGTYDSNPPLPPLQAETRMIPSVDDLLWRCKSQWFGSPVVLLEWNASPTLTTTTTLEELVTVHSEDHASPGRGDSMMPSAFKMTAIPLNGFKQGPRREGDRETIEISQLSPGWHLLRLSQFTEGDSVPLTCSQIQVRVPAKSPWWVAWKVPLGILSIALLMFILRSQRASD